LGKVQSKTALARTADAIRNGEPIPEIKNHNNNPQLIKGDPESNSLYAKMAIEFLSWGKVDKSNVEEMEQRFYRYLEWCSINGIKISNQSAYLAMGITKDDAYEWSNGNVRTKAHSDLIKKVKQICAITRENMMADGKLNPVVGIFWQKNYDGFKDQQEVVLAPKNNGVEDVDEQELIKKYKKSLPSADE
jgi:hypothetical protein